MHYKNQLLELFAIGRCNLLQKGDLQQLSDSENLLSFIESGYIKRYSIDSNGAEGIQVINGPSDIFPLTPIFKTLFNIDIYQGTSTYYYAAMNDAVIYSITQSTLKAAAENDPLIYKELLAAAAVRFESNIQRLENMSLRTTHRRIAHLLAYFADKFGQSTEHGIMILAPLTHQVMAESLNIARETVTRRFTRLEEKKLVLAEGKHIVIPDVQKLRAEIR